MIDRVRLALDELAPVLGLDEPEGVVDRVGVSDRGGLSLTLSIPSGPDGVREARWFSFDDRGLMELTPGADRRLPLARAKRRGDVVLAYRPRRRLVLERPAQADGAAGVEVLKGYRRGRSREALQLHRVAARAAAARSFRVPELLRHEDELDALAFERLGGVPLDLRTTAPEVLHDVGACLAVFQSSTVSEHVPHFAPGDELGVLDRWEARVRLACGRLPEGWSSARKRLEVASAHLSGPRWGLCHRDLHDGQFLLTAEGIALFDFDLLCRADVALDPGNLMAHFTLRSLQDPRIDRACVERHRDAFLQGLPGVGDERTAARVAFYETSTLLRLALVYVVRPRWEALAVPLVQRAVERMAEAVAP